MSATLQAHRIETILTHNGTLTLDNLPFQAGEAVEVIMLHHGKSTGDEVGRRAKEWYAKLRPTVETEENIGKIISIDVETGDYFIGKDVLDSGLAMRARNPDSVLYGIRIGYNAVYSFGGTRKRTEPL